MNPIYIVGSEERFQTDIETIIHNIPKRDLVGRISVKGKLIKEDSARTQHSEIFDEPKKLSFKPRDCGELLQFLLGLKPREYSFKDQTFRGDSIKYRIFVQLTSTKKKTPRSRFHMGTEHSIEIRRGFYLANNIGRSASLERNFLPLDEIVVKYILIDS